jgi:HEAT repeat protein
LAIYQSILLFCAVSIVTGQSFQISQEQYIANLTKTLQDHNNDTITRSHAAEELGYMLPKHEEVVKPLVAALSDDPEPRVRSSAAQSLANVTKNARLVINHLSLTLLRDKETEPSVRSAAANTLGQFSSEANMVLPILGEAIKEDPEVSVRISAVRSIGHLEGTAKVAVPDLIDAFKKSIQEEEGVSRARGAYIEAHPPEDTTDSQGYSVRLTDKFDLQIESLREERRQIAISLGKISKGSVDLRDTNAITPLRSAYGELSKYPEVTSQSDTLSKNISELEDIANPPLLPYFLKFAVYTLAALLCVWLALLALRPLWVLRINEFMTFIPEIKIDKLGGITLSARYLFLVGFFHYNRRVLDAWVSNYLENARKNFNRKPTVADRTLHIPMGIFLNGAYVDECKPEIFKDVYMQHQSRVLIKGEGGAGKTSLACQMANWAMEDRRQRLCPTNAMLPVLIERDVEPPSNSSDGPLFKVISDQLKDNVDAAEAPNPRLIKELLKQRRILVVVDSMSEMSATTRSNILQGLTEIPVNAVIITSRFDEPLNGLIRTSVEPVRIKPDSVEIFIKTYVDRLKKNKLFGQDDLYTGCVRLRELIGEGRDITVILAKYFILNMIASKEGYSEGGPESIPDLMVKYIRLINRKSESTALDNDTVIKAAEVIAWECLKSTYRPLPAKLDDVLEALSRRQQDIYALKYVKDDKEKLDIVIGIEKYLENNLRLIRSQGTHPDRVRFTIDTLSEYLAGLHLVNEYGGSEKDWNNFLTSTDEPVVDRRILSSAFRSRIVDYKENTPESILSFLLAVYDCCVSGEALEQVPSFVIDELEKKIRLRRIIKEMKSSVAEERRRAVSEINQMELEVLAQAHRFIVPNLVGLLIDREAYIREATKSALTKLNEFAVPELILASQREESELGITALRLLTKIRNDER